MQSTLPAGLQADAIQREMQHVRTNLGTDMRNLAQNARESTDWRHYVRRYPWICLSAVAATGYLLVPQKKGALAGALDAGAAALPKNPSAAAAAGGTVAGLTSSLTGMVVRAVASAVVQRGMDLLNRKQNKAAPRPDQPGDGPGGRYSGDQSRRTTGAAPTGSEPW